MAGQTGLLHRRDCRPGPKAFRELLFWCLVFGAIRYGERKRLGGLTRGFVAMLVHWRVFHPLLAFGIQSTNQFLGALHHLCRILLAGGGLSEFPPIRRWGISGFASIPLWGFWIGSHRVFLETGIHNIRSLCGYLKAP